MAKLTCMLLLMMFRAQDCHAGNQSRKYEAAPDPTT
jgi:hypothetical protein